MKLSKKKFANLLNVAATEYLMLKSRRKHPEGTFDDARRFSLATRCECCLSIRTPSRRYPYSEMVHGRSLKHVAHEFGLEGHMLELKRLVRTMEKASEAA
ncbi:hypothetical protein [Allohahella marinimesophila]|uniref:Uncharacterized protein n=1 Tax=Allohahella marinimesophila TaxID=1054972 RepID=A0ABP7NX66_9GAMM